MDRKDNSKSYSQGPSEFRREDLAYQVFQARVMTVDFERKICTLEDLRTGTYYQEVSIFPANASAFESSDVNMPEQFSTCLAVPIWYRGGFVQVAILAYTLQDANRAQEALAVRPIEGVQGLSTRRRGTYRKAFPGQKTATTTKGYTEKVDAGWDRSGRDLSRDHLDPDRKQWTQITSRRVEYSDAGLSFRGPVERPGAANIVPRILPDGSKEYVLFLQPGAQDSDRYISGKQDVIPFAENTQRIQEYALDYPLPQEILETDLLDFVLGTTQDPWGRTSVGGVPVQGSTVGNAKADSESYIINQDVDHPYSRTLTPLGSTVNEGPTPARRGFIVESTKGTLVGYNRFDPSTFGQVLKPVLFPYTKAGRFGSDVTSGYLPVLDSADHAEARLASSTQAIRFPHEANTTRTDVTKEGFVSFEVGSTLPKENIPLAGGYEHPHGAGRSLEGHLVGSIKLVIGKNRDEEDSIDLTALGQTVVRMGADDALPPNDRRTVQTQIRGSKDAVQNRQLQYWKSSKFGLKDAGLLSNKTGFENVSLRLGLDGALIGRVGARVPQALRKHLINGYSDAPGTTAFPRDASRIDSHSSGRPTYPSGDSNYQFTHSSGATLATAGQPIGDPSRGQGPFPPYSPPAWQNPIPAGADAYGLSVDFHTVRDVLLRIGANPDNNQSLLMDLAGGIVAAIGSDKQGRSLTATLDGGIQLHLGKNQNGKSLQLELTGDIDITHFGNLHWQSTGDWVTECTNWRHITKVDQIFTAQKIVNKAVARITNEAPDIVNNQGTQVPAPGDENS